jgi:hypothetical protein
MSLRIAAYSLSFSLVGAAQGQPPPDGFYLRSSEEPVAYVSSQRGETISLGPAQEVAIRGSRIRSEDNANSQFWISLEVPYEVHLQAQSYVLVVANLAYPWAGSGGGNGVYEIDFRVFGADRALGISQFLSTPIQYKRHPGHQLLVTFAPTAPSYRVGDEVRAKFRIENIGGNPIAFMRGGHSRGSPRDNQYTFSARFLDEQIADIGSSDHFGGLVGKHTLAPGDAFQEEVSLDQWFDFTAPGRYEVIGMYDLPLFDPGDEIFWPIWTDYAVGKFTVTVE